MRDNAIDRTPDRRRDSQRQRRIERRTGDERRRAERVGLSLEITVPVVIRSDSGVQRGVARNISEGGVLVEVREPVGIGAWVEVSFQGIRGSRDAPESAVLTGEVRHHLAWQFCDRGGTQAMRGIGIRFVEQAEVIGPPALALRH